MNDEELCTLFWNRDEQAISATHQKYGSWCHAIASRILNIHEETEECVSDTYLTVWNSIPPQRPRVFRAWIGTITRNLALSRYRKMNAAKRGGHEVDLALEELSYCVSGKDTIESEEDRREILRVLDLFLDSLPADQRNIFLKRYWYMIPIADIASSYGMSESKITSMLFRHRKKLRMMLEQEGIAL